MSIDTLNISKAGSNKQIFSRKQRREGLLLQIHHTVQAEKEQKIRFVHAAFDKSGYILAAANQVGNIFLVDFGKNKFWALPNLGLTSCINFSYYNETELIVGINSGDICVVNIDSGDVQGILIGHNSPIADISLADHLCLSSSKREAIVWDLRSYSKVQVLNINPHFALCNVLFISVTNHILASFDDDSILIWKYPAFEIFKEIIQPQWNKQSIKTITFTKNGRAMVLAGYSQRLTVYALDTWTVSGSIALPGYIQSVKKAEFIPELFDGGSNRILGILAGSGTLYFLNMEQVTIINKIVVNTEIYKFTLTLDGQHLACTLKSGEVSLYKVGYYMEITPRPSKQSIKSETSKPSINMSRQTSALSMVQKELQDVLDIEKLRRILNEFGQYPESYRSKIWTQLLGLPNNIQQYNILINHSSHPAFEDLDEEYPLENKVAFNNLKKLLTCLVSWCPFFAQVSYLPVLVFPFVKVFQNDPVLCFEAVATIITNWCQYWFEYFPLPPMNILALIENLLLEHDVQLLNHFENTKVTSRIYAWPLFEALLSEVLTTYEWCRVWDHILSNEPAFFLMVIASYNMLHRQALLKLRHENEFEAFYRNHTTADVKRLISKAYTLLNNTSPKNHPRQYLSPIKPLGSGSYPAFIGFPKVTIDFEEQEIQNLKKERQQLKKDESEIIESKKMENTRIELLERQAEENKRLYELEKACRERLHEERLRVKEQRRRLVDLRKQLHQEELDIINKSKEKMLERNVQERQRTLEKMLSEVAQNREAEELEVVKAESELVKHYSELLRHKILLEEALDIEQPVPDSALEHRILRKQQQELAEELKQIQKASQSKTHLKQLNVATAITALDNLIMKIEMELASEWMDSYGTLGKDYSNIKMLQFQAETKELELEVSKLLHLLADFKTKETQSKLGELHSCMLSEKETYRTQSNPMIRMQKAHAMKEKSANISSLEDVFKNLRKLIRSTRDEYTTMTTSIQTDGETPSIRELAIVSSPR